MTDHRWTQAKRAGFEGALSGFAIGIIGYGCGCFLVIGLLASVGLAIAGVPPGIAIALGLGAPIVLSVIMASSQWTGECPHCGKRTSGSGDGFNCHACKKRIVIKGDQFHRID